MKDTGMKIKLSVKIYFVVLVLISSLCGSVSAAGPWNYLRQLPAADSGVKITLPSALFIDAVAQRYYVVDAGLGQLVSFDKDGKFLAAFNAGGELKTPLSMARTSTGVLWVVNRGDNKLLYINPRQQKVQHYQPSYPDGTVIRPAKVAVDAKNRLFVLDQRRGAILRLDDDLRVVRNYSGDESFRGFVDFKLKGHDIWALDGLARKIYRFGDGNQFEQRIALTGLQFPVALEVDTAGQFYVLDRHAGTVEVFGPQGEKRFDFLGKGKRHGQLWYPKDLLFDWDQRLCIVDEGNVRVDILTR
ncbi:MAG: hypothetical protein GXP51_00825 [Deltaproteobacteria bacterium]|nr:hypothetical protein [Deltaproteobacteria bacterium]